MKEPKRRQSLSGMVLIMILTIMTVLIVLLTATLSVVSSANQRIYTKYEENQAYYTARSALDVFTVKMLSDKTFYAQDASGAKTYIHGNNDTSDKMTQGLGLQLDMYTIASQDGVNVNQSKLNAYASSITVDANKKDEYKNYFGISDTAPVNEIYYEISMPKVGDNADTYGKFSGTEGTDTNIAKIKVEILERTYNLGTYTSGGSSLTVPDGDEKAFVTKSAAAPSGANYASITDDQIAEAVFNGNRKKDTMRVKITATTMFEGNEGNAVLIYDTNEPPMNNSSRAITAFGTISGTNHAYIVGGVSMMGNPANDTNGDGYPDNFNANGIPDERVNVSNGGGVFGTVYDEVGIEYNVTTPTYLTEMEYVYIGGDFKYDNNVNILGAVSDTDIAKRPFIYVAGEIISGGNFTGVGGTTSNPNEKVDLICHGIEHTSNNFTINGDIYCAGDAKFSSTGGTPTFNDNVFIDGDLLVGGNSASATVDGSKTPADADYVTALNVVFGGTGHVYLSGDIKCQVWYNGAEYWVTVPRSNVTMSTTTLEPAFTANAIKNKLPQKDLSSTPPVDEVGSVDTDIDGDGKADTEFTIDLSALVPAATADVRRVIDTRKSNYDEYYAFEADGVTYKDIDSDGKIPDIKPVTEIAGSNFTSDPLPTATLDGLNSGSLTIDTTGVTPGALTDTAYVFNSGMNMNSSPTLKIMGGGTVEIYLNPNGWDGNFDSGNGSLDIIVADDTTLKVYGAVADKTYTFKKVRFWTETTYAGSSAGGDHELNAGSQTGHSIKVPKIYYYFDGGTVVLDQGQEFFTGYFFAPNTELKGNSGSNTSFANLKYNGATVPTSWKFDFFGSLLVGNLNWANDHGVIYVNPDLDSDGNAGEPIHAWKSYRYARN